MKPFRLDSAIACSSASDILKTERIRELNDIFRKNLKDGGVVFSFHVNELPEATRYELLRKLAEFDTFTPENDPYEEHDFGAFEYEDERYFWKIDYYDLNMLFMSPDPADPAFTIRVLTLMHADEY